MNRGSENHVREVCLALPGVRERLSHGAPAFFAGKQFVMLWPDGHHEHRFAHLWCAAATGAQASLLGANPERLFYPPYVGGRGWLGVRLDGDLDVDFLDVLLVDAYRCVATKRQLALVDERGGGRDLDGLTGAP